MESDARKLYQKRNSPFLPISHKHKRVCVRYPVHSAFIKRVCRKSKTYWIIYRSVSVLITLITMYADCANKCRRERILFNIKWQAKGQCLINEWIIQDRIACVALTKRVEFIQKIVINIHVMEKEFEEKKNESKFVAKSKWKKTTTTLMLHYTHYRMRDKRMCKFLIPLIPFFCHFDLVT